MITAREATIFLLGAGAVIAGIAACGMMIQMTEEVNARLPLEDRHMEVFWYPGQSSKVATVHRLFYPKSKVRIRRNLFAILMVLFAIAWIVAHQFYF